MHKTTLPALLCAATLMTIAPASVWAGDPAQPPAAASSAATAGTATSDKTAPSMAEAQKAYDNGSYEETFIIVEPLAQLNHPEAEYLLGRMYELGHGVEKDMQKALDLFTKAASQGYAAAQARLGSFHLETSKDYNSALGWFHKAADQGYALAYSSLGNMYAKGYGVSQDYARAIEYYRKAAMAGDPKACLRLGTMYEKGEGVTADLKQAAQVIQIPYTHHFEHQTIPLMALKQHAHHVLFSTILLVH